MSVATITPSELEAMRLRGSPVELIDVRTPVEYREVHAEPARLVPLERLDPREVMEARHGSKDDPLYLICRSGSRGQQACEKFLGRRVSPMSSTSRAAPWPGNEPACRWFEARRRSRWSGRCGSRPDRSCVLGTALGAFVHPASSALRRSSGRASSSPASPTLAGWGCSWPGCPGTGSRIPAACSPAHREDSIMKLLIVGGVAGGASAAARARRLSEDADIVLFERGPDVSFANCGLPYYIGGEIAERDKLLVVTPERSAVPLQA